MASDRPISLRLPADLITEIDRRTTKPDPHGKEADREREYGRADALRGALNRYYEICRRHLGSLGLSRAELAVCCDALNGGMLGMGDGGTGVGMIQVVWAEIADAIQLSERGPLGRDGGILAKHERDGERIDGPDFVRRLKDASYADLVALVDFVERFWANDPDAEKVIEWPNQHGAPA